MKVDFHAAPPLTKVHVMFQTFTCLQPKLFVRITLEFWTSSLARMVVTRLDENAMRYKAV
jgi:hypothetical protein